MQFFFDLLVGGLSMGACYALVALAMVIIYKTSEVPNFAQGEMAMLSTFVAYSLMSSYHVGFWTAIIATLLFALVLGFLLEIAFLRPAKDPTVLSLIVITLGAEMILYGLAGWKWGANQNPFQVPFSEYSGFRIGGVLITEINLWTFVTSLVIMLLLFLFFRYTKVGVAMKAVQQNAFAAKAMGIPTRRILTFTWGLSSVTGAVAGVLIAPIATLDTNMMMDPMLKGFAGAVLGGMTSLPGAALGGYLLGIIENCFGGYVSLEFKSVVAFGLIVLILCLKPTGLFVKHFERKV
ncbi:branched-chain amino acid ABC transporter permease [Desulfomonile tiedjei]|uniref:Amino acid/amide ABC transporter membrane protein 1, HAAT family n=1 Tax=Desulfomonile tiedjei (strain ATCC 49306 / DSM 6799 / DCB-1) TaxID=706587 RepID=I4CBM5_DESTA|nr:branched-chain amino acid ABC transporter permease [Desulfomonile tiedjei]AFM26966.1 amino acid/amide ABC transporter membrane protein 1, HAAT family [Desulfomonile tiedjei DSM 6799]